MHSRYTFTYNTLARYYRYATEIARDLTNNLPLASRFYLNILGRYAQYFSQTELSPWI